MAAARGQARKAAEVDPTDAAKARTEKVARKDNFVSGDISLPDELSTTEDHYAHWNKKEKKKRQRPRALVPNTASDSSSAG